MKSRRFLKITAFICLICIAALNASIPAYAWMDDVIYCGVSVNSYTSGSYSAQSVPDTEYDETTLPIDLRAGYNTDTLIYGYNPLQLTVTNNTGSDIDGYALISQTSYYYSSDNVNKTHIDLSVASGVSKKLDFTMYLDGANTIQAEIYSSSGKLLRSVIFSYSQNYSEPIFHIGWLSDDASDGKMLSGIMGTSVWVPSFQSTYGTGSAYLFPETLTPSAFPADFSSIMSFDWIIIGDADLSASSSFSKKQLELLKAYIDAGGTVIVSTGDETDVLQFFSSYFSGNVSKAVSTKKEEKVKEYQGNTYFPEESLTIFTLDFTGTFTEINDPNFTLISTNAQSSTVQNPIAYYMHSSKNLYICNADLSSKALVNYSYSPNMLICSLLKAGATAGDVAEVPYVDDDILESLVEPDINFGILLLIILTYAGVGIVLPYCLARKKKKSRIAWAGIPAAALLFSMLLFGYSYIARAGFKGVTTVEITRLYEGGSGISSYSFSEVKRSGGTRRYTVNADSVTYDKDNSGSNGSTVTIGKEAGLILSGEPWTAAYGHAKASFTGGGSFSMNFTENDNGTFDITITNGTGKNYSNLVFYCLGNTVIIGQLKAGESYTQSGLTKSTLDFDLEAAAIALYYTPLGLNTNNFKEKIKYLNKGYSYSGEYIFEDLEEESEESYLNATAMYSVFYGSITKSYYYSISTKGNFDSDDIVICGTEDDTENAVLVNGSELTGSKSLKLAYQTFDISRDNSSLLLNYEDSLWRSSNSIGLSGGVIKLNQGNTALMYTAAIETAYFTDCYELSFSLPEDLDPSEWSVQACLLTSVYGTEYLTEFKMYEDGKFTIDLSELAYEYGLSKSTYDNKYNYVYSATVITAGNLKLTVDANDGLTPGDGTVPVCIVFEYTGNGESDIAAVPYLKYAVSLAE